MSAVTGAFKPNVPQPRQKAILDKLSRMPGVRAAGLVKANAKSADMRLLFYVQVDEDHANSLVEELRKHDEVAVAEVEPRRGLA
jgi:hypothetical protein